MKKITSITFSIIIFLILAGCGWFYYLTNKDINPVEIGVENNFFDFDSVIADLLAQSHETGETSAEPSTLDEQNTDLVDDGPSSSHAEQSNPQAGDQQQSAEDNTTFSNSSPIIRDDAVPVTEDDIRSKYEPLFLTLQDTALSRLDTLTEKAWAEYQNTKTGTSTLSLVDISSMYMSAGNKLQSNVDNTFYALLEQMKEELEKNNLSLTLVNETEMQYQQAIRHKQSEIMSKATEIMG